MFLSDVSEFLWCVEVVNERNQTPGLQESRPYFSLECCGRCKSPMNLPSIPGIPTILTYTAAVHTHTHTHVSFKAVKLLAHQANCRPQLGRRLWPPVTRFSRRVRLHLLLSPLISRRSEAVGGKSDFSRFVNNLTRFVCVVLIVACDWPRKVTAQQNASVHSDAAAIEIRSANLCKLGNLKMCLLGKVSMWILKVWGK